MVVAAAGKFSKQINSNHKWQADPQAPTPSESANRRASDMEMDSPESKSEDSFIHDTSDFTSYNQVPNIFNPPEAASKTSTAQPQSLFGAQPSVNGSLFASNTGNQPSIFAKQSPQSPTKSQAPTSTFTPLFSTNKSAETSEPSQMQQNTSGFAAPSATAPLFGSSQAPQTSQTSQAQQAGNGAPATASPAKAPFSLFGAAAPNLQQSQTQRVDAGQPAAASAGKPLFNFGSPAGKAETARTQHAQQASSSQSAAENPPKPLFNFGSAAAGLQAPQTEQSQKASTGETAAGSPAKPLFNFGSATPGAPASQTGQSVFSGFNPASPSKPLFSAGTATQNDSQPGTSTTAPDSTQERGSESLAATPARSLLNAAPTTNSQSQTQTPTPAFSLSQPSQANQTIGANNAAAFTPATNPFTFGSFTPSAPQQQTSTPSLFSPPSFNAQQATSYDPAASSSPMSMISSGSITASEAQSSTQPPPSSNQSSMASTEDASTNAASPIVKGKPKEVIELGFELDPSLSTASSSARDVADAFLYNASELKPHSVPLHFSAQQREQYIFMFRMHTIDNGFSQYLRMAEDMPNSKELVKRAQYYYSNMKNAIKRLAGDNLNDVEPSNPDKPVKEDPKKRKRCIDHGDQLVTVKRAQLETVANEKNGGQRLPNFVFPTAKKRAADENLPEDVRFPASKKVHLDHTSSNGSKRKSKAPSWLTSTLISREVKQSSKEILDQYSFEESQPSDEPRRASDNVAAKDFAYKASSNRAMDDSSTMAHTESDLSAQQASTESADGAPSFAGRSIFDRIEIDEDGEPRRETHLETSAASENTQNPASALLPHSGSGSVGVQGNPFAPKTSQNSSTSFTQFGGSQGDKTWKPESPIRFGGSSVASNGNIFSSTTNGAQEPEQGGNKQAEVKKSQSLFSTSNDAKEGGSKPMASFFNSVGDNATPSTASTPNSLFAKPAEASQSSQKPLSSIFDSTGAKPAPPTQSNIFSSNSMNASEDATKSPFSSSVPFGIKASATGAAPQSFFSHPPGSSQSVSKTFTPFGSSGAKPSGDNAGTSTATAPNSIITKSAGASDKAQPSLFGTSKLNGATVTSADMDKSTASTGGLFKNHSGLERGAPSATSPNKDPTTNGNTQKTPSIFSDAASFKPAESKEALTTGNHSSDIFTKSLSGVDNPQIPTFSFAHSKNTKPSASSASAPAADAFGSALAKSRQADENVLKSQPGFGLSTNNELTKGNEALNEAVPSSSASVEPPRPAEKVSTSLFGSAGFTKANSTSGGVAPPATSILGSLDKSQRESQSASKAPIFTFTNSTANSAAIGTPFADPAPSKEVNEKGPFTKNIFGYLNPDTSQPRLGSLAAAPGSVLSSAATSRASTPGLTTGEESNAESATGEDDAMAAEEQLDLSTANAGEEKEEVLMQVRAKASMFNPEGTDKDKNQWITKGLGELKVLKNEEDGTSRVLMRADGSGKVLLNTTLLPEAKYDTASTKSVNLAVATDKGVQRCVLLVKKPEDAMELAKVLTENK